MKCCAKCIGDKRLSSRISEISMETGDCGSCGSRDQDLISPLELQEYFGPLIGIYTSDENGLPILDWLRKDWLLFPDLDDQSASELVSEILNDDNIVTTRYSPSEPDHKELQDPWDKLIDDLMYKNRYFLNTDFNFGRLGGLLSHIEYEINDENSTWYRARIEKDEHLYKISEMGAPPKRKATQGRANPAGIPYLYLGSALKAAAAEVRPNPGDIVCIAEFQLKENLNLVDLRNPRQLISPFLIGDETMLSTLRGGDISFLENLGQQLTIPVSPDAAAIDYTGSQYLCEFIKKSGYDGIVYSSSVSDGVNMALFYPNLAEPKKVKEYRIEKAEVKLSLYKRK